MNLSHGNKRRSSAVINIRSLIDVVLLLLIFFMLTTRFVEQPGMKLDLPESQSGESGDIDENTIYISSDGQVSLNDETLSIDQLQEKLKTLVDTASVENAIVIKADRSIDHGTVVKIMDKTRLAGFQKLIIATEKE